MSEATLKASQPSFQEQVARPPKWGEALSGTEGLGGKGAWHSHHFKKASCARMHVIRV